MTFNGLQIEMAALKTLGDRQAAREWLGDAFVQTQITTPGIADSFLQQPTSPILGECNKSLQQHCTSCNIVLTTATVCE